MKLDKPIKIQQYPFTDNNGKLITPAAVELPELNITFFEQPKFKVVGANIQGVPKPIILYSAEQYDALGDQRSISGLNKKLKELMGEDPQTYLQSLIPKTLEADPDGPGSILSGMISAMGIKSTPNCSCRRHALEMNEKGPDWCEENLGTILSWLKEESEKRKLPFVRSVAKMMVQRAIKKSRRLLEKAKKNG